MLAPHIVTLFVATEGADFTLSYSRKVLNGVFLDTTKSRSVSNTGLGTGDNATLYIPISTHEDLTDIPVDGESSCAECFFIKGQIDSDISYSNAKKTYRDVYRVSSVKLRDFGSRSMHHWEVGGV